MKYISPGSWFSLEYPNDWREFEDEEDSFLFIILKVEWKFPDIRLSGKIRKICSGLYGGRTSAESVCPA